MQVPLIDLKAQYSTIRDEIEAAIREVCESQYFVLGPKVEEFERQVAEYSGVEHAVGVSSGTDALLLALMALDIGPGDEVLTTPYTFFATAGTIARLGARPLFCDIDAATFNLDPLAVAETLGGQCERNDSDLVNRQTGGRVRAILPVHLFGQMADMDALLEIAREYRLPVIEDAAQAIGAELGRTRGAGGLGDGGGSRGDVQGSRGNGRGSGGDGGDLRARGMSDDRDRRSQDAGNREGGGHHAGGVSDGRHAGRISDGRHAVRMSDTRRAGSLGAIGCFSFFPTKNLGAFGDAGMCVSNDAELAARIRKLRVHGGHTKYLHDEVGGNFRLDALQAAVLLVKLAYLDQWTRARQANAARYGELIEAAAIEEFVTPPSAGEGRHIFNQYVIRARRRDDLRTWLAEQGVSTAIYYPLALHEQACFANLGHAPDDFPNARLAAAETLALPIYPELSDKQIEHVVASAASFCRSRLSRRTWLSTPTQEPMPSASKSPMPDPNGSKREARISYETLRPQTNAPLFDTHIFVDWSAASSPTQEVPCENAIWWAAASAQDGCVRRPQGISDRHGHTLVTEHDTVYVRTRNAAVDGLVKFVDSEIESGRRVLMGFDFPFGYPVGFAKRLTGVAYALEVWNWLAERISDDSRNRNNRFKVAAAINNCYPGVGPFWGRPWQWDGHQIPHRQSKLTHRDTHPREFRITEKHAAGAKSVWQLYGAGSVGSQVLVGLPAVNKVRKHESLAKRTSVWPFDSGLRVPEQEKRLVIAEIYPSLLKEAVSQGQQAREPQDSAQVRVNATAFASLDARGHLDALFLGPAGLTERERQIVESEEGWILGVGHERALADMLPDD